MRAIALLLAACGSVPHVAPPADLTTAPLSIPSQNVSTTVDVGCWNLEWFGDVAHGPSDEALQKANVTTVLEELDLDLVGVEEVVDVGHFQEVISALPHRSAVLASDPIVQDGAAYYAKEEQKVGLVFDDRFGIDHARLILKDQAWAFAGRPPLELGLRFEEDGEARTLVVIVLHMKAGGEGYERRHQAALALEEYLSTAYPKRWVLVLGDWNDSLDGSIAWGKPSPFSALTNDTAYRFVTKELTESTTVSHTRTIDHHLVTDDLAKRYVEGSARVLHLDQWIEGYGTTTSDHFPVVSSYDLR